MTAGALTAAQLMVALANWQGWSRQQRAGYSESESEPELELAQPKLEPGPAVVDSSLENSHDAAAAAAGHRPATDSEDSAGIVHVLAVDSLGNIVGRKIGAEVAAAILAVGTALAVALGLGIQEVVRSG